MGKHNRPRRQKGFGAKGSGIRWGLEQRLKLWDEILNNKTSTRATLRTATTATFARPGCKAAGYTKPGSNKK
jgi:hypothetical protein